MPQTFYFLNSLFSSLSVKGETSSNLFELIESLLSVYYQPHLIQLGNLESEYLEWVGTLPSGSALPVGGVFQSSCPGARWPGFKPIRSFSPIKGLTPY